MQVEQPSSPVLRHGAETVSWMVPSLLLALTHTGETDKMADNAEALSAMFALPSHPSTGRNLTIPRWSRLGSLCAHGKCQRSFLN